MILTSHSGYDWDRGRYHIERACDHRRGQRSAECHTSGWHTISTSDDLSDAHIERSALACYGLHRITDSHTGAVIP